MAIEITDELIRHVARLSRLALSEDEARALKEHFEKVLAYVASFQELDTGHVDPSPFSVEGFNVYREDEVLPSLPRERALANAPQADGTFFIVPRIVGDADQGA